MKKYTLLIALALLTAVLLCAVSCGKSDTTDESSAASGHIPLFTEIEYTTYIYEKDGMGGAFTISLGADGSFTYYEGWFSSHIGDGDFKIEDGILTMTEKVYSGETPRTYRFNYESDCLTYIDEGSDSFSYIKVSDGEKFPLYNEEEHKGELVFISHLMQSKAFINGDNVVTLRENGTFSYSKGQSGACLLEGTWSEKDGMVTLTYKDKADKELTALFSYDGKSLAYIAQDSDSTAFPDISNGDKLADISFIESSLVPSE